MTKSAMDDPHQQRVFGEVVRGFTPKIWTKKELTAARIQRVQREIDLASPETE